MTFAPLTLMFARVDRYGADSDTALFTELLYVGEFILKITTAAFIAAIEDDRENHRYRLLHDLIRADGLGQWARAVDEALTGPTSQQLAVSFTETRRTFTERLGKGNWQQQAVHDMHDVLVGVNSSTQPISDKVALRTWFQLFAELRNKTRGHGALTPSTCAKLVSKLDSSIQNICANNPILKMPWAYLHRNLSGKYNVIGVGGDQKVFDKLKIAAAAAGENYIDWLYLLGGSYRRVELNHLGMGGYAVFVRNWWFQKATYERPT